MAKKLRFLFTLLFIMAATLSWGDNYTVTFKTGTGYGSSVSTSTACSAIVSEGASYLKGNVATATKAYYGGSDGLKLGTSSSIGKIKMNLASNVTPTSIVVSAKLYNSSKSATLKVNGSTAQDISADFTDLTFAITSEISYIELESSKYCWIKSITVNYANDTRVSTITSFPQNRYTAYLGEDFSAPDATLTANGGTLSEELSYSSSNTNVATVASDGSVLLKAKGTTTITATFAGNNNYIGSSASYTLKVENAPIIPKPINIGSDYYVKVTSADELVDGDAILIVNESNKYAMSTTQNTNNRGQEIVIIADNTNTIDAPKATVQKIILVKSVDKWYLNVGRDGDKNSFLYAASSSNNYLKSTTDPDNNALASISVTNGNATIEFQGDNTRNLLRYNSNSSLFSCYASGQQDIQIYKEVPVVAQIGNQKFETLQAAFNAATEGQTVTLLKDYDASAEFPFTAPNGNQKRNLGILNSTTFDGSNHTLTVKGNGIWVGGGSSNVDVIIKNIIIKNAQNEGRCVDTRGSLNSLTLDNATLSTEGKEASQPLTIGGDQKNAATVKILNGSTVATSEDGKYGYAITTFNPVNMTIDGSTIKGWACLNIRAASSSAGSNGSVFNITNSKLTSKNVYAGTSNAYSVFKIEDVDVTINVTNTTINVDGAENSEAIVGFQPGKTNGSIVNLGEGNNVVFTGTTSYAQNDNAASKLLISGGIFNQPVPEQNCAEGMIPVDLGEGKYSVKVGSYVAQVGKQKYETFVEAVAAVTEENNVITLLANVTEGYTIAAGKALNVKLNGFNLTVNAPEGYLLKTTEADGVTTYTIEAIPVVIPTAPVVFHDSGEYEAGLSVPMFAQAGAKIYYTTDGSEPTTASTEYTGALKIENATTLKAIAVLDGVASAVVTRVYTIADAAEKVTAFDGYYSIKNGTGKYINVAGRKTVTFTDAIDDKAGTVIKVKTNDKGQVEVLRSQGVDLPGYAKKAMNYVPEIVQLVVDKLHAEGSGEILGENGLDAIMKKFNESFDYHLYI